MPLTDTPLDNSRGSPHRKKVAILWTIPSNSHIPLEHATDNPSENATENTRWFLRCWFLRCWSLACNSLSLVPTCLFETAKWLVSGATFCGHSKRGLSKGKNNERICSRIVELLLSPLLLCPLISAPNSRSGCREEQRRRSLVPLTSYYRCKRLI